MPTDPNWSSVTMLLPGNGTNGAQNNTFLDGSTNNFTITRNGNTTQGTFSPFTAAAPYSAASKGGSGYFDGTGDTLGVPSITIGTSNFCFECWFYPTVAQGAFAGFFVGATNGALQCSYQNASGTGLGIARKGVGFDITNTDGVLPIVGQWNHVAFVRSGTSTNQTSIFLNGTRIANGTVSSNYAASTYEVSTTLAGGSVLQGYVSSARLVVGSSVYDATQSTLTVPTAPLTAITNTSLLLNFTNAGIIDNAMMNDLETVGNAQISTAQSKFGGSSLYFDGTGDYLVSNSDANIYAFGSGNFTIEFWLRLDTAPASDCLIYDSRPASTQGLYPTLYHNSGQIRYFTNSADRITGSTLSTGVWYHIALARSGTSTRLFVDGTQVGSTYSDSNVYINGSQRPVIATSGVLLAFNMQGYIDDLRVTKGVARYTANFTPPAAAFPTS